MTNTYEDYAYCKRRHVPLRYSSSFLAQQAVQMKHGTGCWERRSSSSTGHTIRVSRYILLVEVSSQQMEVDLFDMYGWTAETFKYRAAANCSLPSNVSSHNFRVV